MKDYDIRSAFEQMELELIVSMRRNLAKHQDWETDEGMNWTMWQAEQLKTFEEFKRNNKELFEEKFSTINKEIEELLKETYELSGFEQEREILKAIKDNKSFNETLSKGLNGSFFSLNEKKMNALINATTKDMKKAEHAMLRMTNDQYRKTIFKAQTMANSGAFTLKQSIDAATKDFLKAGINCIEYKNGRMVNIASYAEMAIRTANKRAMLISEGEVRKAMGIHTVKISKYGGCSETCQPWQGKVYVDDVFSGGSKEEAQEKNLPLLSEAINGGLYHPNCKHRSVTYYYDLRKSLGKLKDDGLENPPEEKEHRINQLHIQQQERLEKGSLDPKNIAEAKAKKEQWIKKDDTIGYEYQGHYVSTYQEARTIEEAQDFASQYVESRFMDKTFKGQVSYKGISVDNANKINKALANIYDRMEISKISGIKVVTPTSAQGKKAFKSGVDAMASYDPIQHGIYLNKDILKDDEKFKEYVKKSNEAWDLVMNNIDKLSGNDKKLAITYKNAGRSLVDGESIEGIINHEMGHHVQWDVLDVKTNNAMGSRMSEYAYRISGYANETKSEYIAESFSAFMKDEKDILDKEFVEFMDKYNKVSDVNYLESDGLFDKLKNKAKSQIIGEKVIRFNELPSELKNGFINQLPKSDVYTRKILEKYYDTVSYTFSENFKVSKQNSKMNLIFLNNKNPSALAHELFHVIDAKLEITKDLKLSKILEKEYVTLLHKANGRIPYYLINKYPEAFTVVNDSVRIKEEYRGISDILSGLSKGEIKLGYGHKKEYWEASDSRCIQESWAQYGRIGFDGNQEVIDMLRDLFPEFVQESTKITKGLIK